MPQKASFEESVQVRANAARLFREMAERILVGEHPMKALPIERIGSTLARLAFLDTATSCLEVFTAIESSFMSTAHELERDDC